MKEQKFKVPKGWKLVPIKPTEKMLDAAEDTYVSTYTGTAVSCPHNVYKAMLKSAPKYGDEK